MNKTYIKRAVNTANGHVVRNFRNRYWLTALIATIGWPFVFLLAWMVEKAIDPSCE